MNLTIIRTRLSEFSLRAAIHYITIHPKYKCKPSIFFFFKELSNVSVKIVLDGNSERMMTSRFDSKCSNLARTLPVWLELFRFGPNCSGLARIVQVWLELPRFGPNYLSFRRVCPDDISCQYADV